MAPMRLAIIGAGAFGTAMACVLRRSGHGVVLWGRDPQVVESVNAQRSNPRHLPGVPLEPGIAATADLAAALARSELVLTAVPAQQLRPVAARMRAALAPGTPVASCSKGIERGSRALMPQVLAEALPQARVAVLSGPSFAREIALGLPCGVDLACAEVDFARHLSLQVGSARFCIHPSNDLVGVALGGVMKNVIGIASGIAAGRKLGENARATLLARGLAETLRLGAALGAQRDTFLGLSGIGDMTLTAASLQSRNTAFGVALGEGASPQEILRSRRGLTEGVLSVEAVVALAARLEVSMPITEALDRVLNRGASLDAEIERFLERA